MNLKDNPIFITQKRLVHRGGVLAAILIAALVGVSLLSGLIAYLADPLDFSDFHSPQEAGKMFYGWTMGIEILVLIVGGCSRISTTLVNERKAGLWDSNRLTPLHPRELIFGYWFGSPLREFYMAAILAGIGLVIILLAKLSIVLWLGTQILIFSTALFFGLLGVLLGMALQKPQGILIFLLLFFIYPFSFMAPSHMLSNFLLPIYGITHLFMDDSHRSEEWTAMPHIFGIPFYPILSSLLLQAAVGIFIWRAVVRKAANPFQPLLLRWEALVLFAILVGSQHGLIWDLWHGNFPIIHPRGHDYRDFQDESLMQMAHGSTMLIGILLLMLSSPQPESIRVESMRLGSKNFNVVFSRSSISLALALTGIAAFFLFTECAASFADSWKVYFIAIVNLLNVFLIFSLLLEFCRLRHKRRALGFVALWLFVIAVLPFILAGVFTNAAIGRISLISPGFIALSDSNDDPGHLLGIVIAHFGIVVLLFIVWQRQWKRLLAKAV